MKTRKYTYNSRSTLISSRHVFIISLSLDAKLIPLFFMFKATYAFLRFSRAPIAQKYICATLYMIWQHNAVTKISLNTDNSPSTWFSFCKDDNFICEKIVIAISTRSVRRYIKRILPSVPGQILRVNTRNRLYRNIQHHFSRARGYRHCMYIHAVYIHIYVYVYEFWEFDGRRERSCWEPVLVLY